MANFIVGDTEDDSKELLAAGKSGFLKTVTQIAARTDDGASYYSKGDKKSFLRWVTQRKERFIYFHNLQYDLGNLFADKLDCLDQVLVGGRLIRATWGNKVFVDSFNIWPMSAKKIGKAFGMEKLEMDVHSREYVFRDVEIIRQAMLFAWQFCDGLGIKYLPSTLGGLCIKVWKSLGGENCHDSSELSRQALFGGRVELHKQRNDSDYVANTDINSLYPSVMRNRFPGMLEPCDDIPEYGIVRCTVDVPECEFPVLPYRNDEGRIFYGWGKFDGTWTVPELTAAVKRGAKILKVHECLGSSGYEIPYGTYVHKMYQARLQAGSEAESLFFKLLMNNLYGRLGTSGQIGRSVLQTEKNRYDGIPYGEKVLVKYQMPLAEETNWSHAAYVTAYGRLQLLQYMEKVGADKMIYCDTDSCIFDCPEKKLPFAVGKELGEMKQIEYKLKGSKPSRWWPACQTFAPKMYSVGSEYKAKGVPKRLAQTFIETGRAEFDLPFKMREAIRFYDRKNIRKLSVWRTVSKEKRSDYDRKRLVGNRYFPCKVKLIS